MFAEPRALVAGLLMGIVFGLLLQKGRVAKYPVIVGQFLLRDWTVLKIMATAVVVGSIGVYALVQLGVAGFTSSRPTWEPCSWAGSFSVQGSPSSATARARALRPWAKAIATPWSG